MAPLLALSACGGISASSSAASPHETLVALQRASAAGDAAALYAMLPERARRDESFEQFRARVATEQPEVRELGAAIQRGLDDHRVAGLDLPVHGGGSFAVVDDASGWRVAHPGFGPGAATSPGDAARALRDAILRQSLPAVLQTLSARARGALQAEMTSLADALEDPSSLVVTSVLNSGQRVEVHLHDGRTLHMVREGQSWHIDDVQ